MNNLIEIKKDCFNICGRVKQINKDYILFFSPKLAQFELFTKVGLNMRHELSFAKQSLDYSVLNKIYKTRRERLDEILAEIDKQNEVNEREQKQALLKTMQKEIEKL